MKRRTYSELVGIVRERNRPSGGIRSVVEVIRSACIGKESVGLEIGCNTGFAAANLSAISKCRMYGIDLISESLAEAKNYAECLGVGANTDFTKMDVSDLKFEDNTFDFVWLSNVISFIEDKERALSECLRVLKNNGTLITIPIYYIRTPPESLVKEISEAIDVAVRVHSKEFWQSFFTNKAKDIGYNLYKYWDKDFIYEDKSDSSIQAWCEEILSRDHLKLYNIKIRQRIHEDYMSYMKLFNHNLQYCGFSIMLFQKRLYEEEPELFYSYEVNIV